ncbi:hypothetical protein [Brevibacillus choshinensis]|uniref:hypothetical protein n=1 Tax=Brevibacillus choshinensis TaxID=54911 RepID=UPI002E24F3B2|nr:hypothetical protein [Brevibacillus sp.]MED4586354.1 hypothetical protein [Brevibacillus choshinensis]MED4754279.1 hypothetical protein [Brevibacillus choshinensis]MED4782481.1 hypothetical protein [Brevibacillus choshinensis]
MTARKAHAHMTVAGHVRPVSRHVSRQVWRSLLAQRARKVYGQIPPLQGAIYHNGPSVLDPEEGIVVIATKEAGFKRPRYIG